MGVNEASSAPNLSERAQHDGEIVKNIFEEAKHVAEGPQNVSEKAKTVADDLKQILEATKSAGGDCRSFMSSEIDNLKYEVKKLKLISNVPSGSEAIIEECDVNLVSPNDVDELREQADRALRHSSEAQEELDKVWTEIVTLKDLTNTTRVIISQKTDISATDDLSVLIEELKHELSGLQDEFDASKQLSDEHEISLIAVQESADTAKEISNQCKMVSDSKSQMINELLIYVRSFDQRQSNIIADLDELKDHLSDSKLIEGSVPIDLELINAFRSLFRVISNSLSFF
jgi:GTPase SAR1 family protein